MFDKDKRALIAVSGEEELCIAPRMANRHGLVAGATGTGKTVTLQVLAETFSAMGTPVFAADMKGDLSGVAAPGGAKESISRRVGELRLAEKGFAFQGFPTHFWDVFGEAGVSLRATVGDMGPLLLARLLGLNETQSGVLTLVFTIARDESLELIDLKDLRKLLEYAANNATRYSATYGNVSMASVGAIQRALLGLEHEGGDQFFGEPALNVDDLIQTEGGMGVVNILAAERLVKSPKVYAVFLVWLMSRLFDVLPEVGDPEKPKLVFFFDEAHLLFSDAPRALVEKVEQVVRLIRSKGVGIYFVSQSPSDIPDAILGQLGNRVQHALRAFTPKDQKTVKVAAATFRANPGFDVEKAITELGIGEALVSFLDDKGMPRPVERALIVPPQGQIGPLDAQKREGMFKNSLLYRCYGETRDRESAFEKLQNTETAKERAAREKAEEKARKEEEKQRLAREKEEERQRLAREKEEERQRLAQEKEERREDERRKTFWGGLIKSVVTPVIRNALNSYIRGGKKR
ncbi:MAG: DUF853 domain-containing protein [Candidatus Accumulibacter sp.]|jgi:DNA helicase HerA-like ATPase|nr:DUF853 domain-containing protein [Accumulibacter sp.]